MYMPPYVNAVEYHTTIGGEGHFVAGAIHQLHPRLIDLKRLKSQTNSVYLMCLAGEEASKRDSAAAIVLSKAV